MLRHPLALLTLLFAVSAGPAFAYTWGTVGTVSNTNANRVCVGYPDGDADVTCPSYSPSITTAGDVSVSGALEAARFIGDGSGLTGLGQGDRITSGTSNIIVNNNGAISFTTAGTERLAIDADGHMAIGTIPQSPYLLTISPTGGQVGLRIVREFANYTYPALRFDTPAGAVGSITPVGGGGPMITGVPYIFFGSLAGDTQIGRFSSWGGMATLAVMPASNSQPGLTVSGDDARNFSSFKQGVMVGRNWEYGDTWQPSATLHVSGSLMVNTNGSVTPALYAGTDGNVGIGTTSPDIYSLGSARVFGIQSGGVSVSLQALTSGSKGFFAEATGSLARFVGYQVPLYLDTNGAFDLIFRVNTSEAMRILASSGNVGIGITGPVARLHVSSTSGQLALENPEDKAWYFVATSGHLYIKQATDSTTNSYVHFGRSDSIYNSGISAKTGEAYFNGGIAVQGNAAPSQGLRLSDEGSYKQLQSYELEPLYINPLGNNVILNPYDGNVGVGTVTPTAKLEVAGTVSATNFVGDGSGLTNLNVGAVAVDRIVSGTGNATRVVAISDTGYISVTQAGANTAWFDPTFGLVTLGVSATGTISATLVNAASVSATNISVTNINGQPYGASTALGDRISTTGVSSGATLGMAVADKGTVSFTLGGTAGAAYLHPTLGLVTPGVSATGTVSATYYYAAPISGLGAPLSLSGSNLPGGNNTNVQYQSGGALAGSDDFTWDDGDSKLVIAGTVSATYFVGDGSGLTNVPAGSTDRIVSGSVSAIAQQTSGTVKVSGTLALINTGNETCDANKAYSLRVHPTLKMVQVCVP